MKLRFKISIKPYGDKALLIEWPNKIDDEILDDIIQFTSTILKHEEGQLINHIPGYNSLVLQYDSEFDFDNKERLLQDLYLSQTEISNYSAKTWHIPVCYHEDFGIDLPLFANQGLSSKEVVELHISNPFRVFMIGFLPGFLYLGGLPQQLHMSRKEKPRLNVAHGAVAIGGEQTGIYPMDSPGGWQIIGRTPLALFDLSLDNPTPIKQGDNIQFYAIDKVTFQNLSSH